MIDCQQFMLHPTHGMLFCVTRDAHYNPILVRMADKAQTVSDHEIHIKYEDQEKINQFARYNSKLLEIKVINQLGN